MTHWIIPSNDSMFRICDAIQARHSLIDWRAHYKYNVGDIVYIYKTRPYCCISYKMFVIKMGFTHDESFDKEKFWTDKQAYKEGQPGLKYVRLKLIEQIEDNKINLAMLKAHGLKGNLQGARRLSDELLDFIESSFRSNSVNNNDCEVDYPGDSTAFYEGAVMKVLVNKYERNANARKVCIQHFGCKCVVCGCDFSQRYGELGEGFIHVHHIVPIGSIGKEYVLDPVKDLVPVCPNCHYMLHSTTPPMQPKALKELMEEQSNLQVIKNNYDKAILSTLCLYGTIMHIPS